mgnify:CR=1 FL=1
MQICEEQRKVSSNTGLQSPKSDTIKAEVADFTCGLGPILSPVLSESARFLQHSLSLWPFLPQYQHSAADFPCRFSSPRLPLFLSVPSTLILSFASVAHRLASSSSPRGLSPSVYIILLSVFLYKEHRL